MQLSQPFSLTKEQIEAYRRDGFLSIPCITSPEEVAWIREIYDRLFDQKRGWDEGNFFDFAGPDTDARPSLPQLLLPSRYEPALANAICRANATIIARQLLGPNARLVFEHAIMKPAHGGPATPWHQDQAFFPVGTRYESIAIWMPLQDVEAESGCLQYIPGSHRTDLLPHRSLNNDPRIHALEVVGADTSAAVACPLAAGGAVVHHCRTLHGGGPNTLGIPRRAYVLGFGVRSKKIYVRQEYPWNAHRQTERHRRYLKSRSVVQRLRDRLRALRARAGL